MNQALVTRILIVLSCVVAHLGVLATAEAISLHQQHHSRTLSAWPLPVPYPFAFPKDIAESARVAKKKGQDDFHAYAVKVCKLIAEPAIQGSREFRDMNGVKLWPMMLSVARAAYVYPEDVTNLWGEVFQICNDMGGMAAEGIGYGVAYIYAEGIAESIGMTQILESAFARGLAASDGDGCKGVDQILDIAAAVIKSRDVAADELHLAMETYSKLLAKCTPMDKQQKFKPYTIRGDIGLDKSRAAGSP